MPFLIFIFKFTHLRAFLNVKVYAKIINIFMVLHTYKYYSYLIL